MGQKRRIQIDLVSVDIEAMKTILFILSAVILTGNTASAKGVRVRGYVKKNGSYVSPSIRTSPDRSKINNYSSKGNINPYTGKKGSK